MPAGVKLSVEYEGDVDGIIGNVGATGGTPEYVGGAIVGTLAGVEAGTGGTE